MRSIALRNTRRTDNRPRAVVRSGLTGPAPDRACRSAVCLGLPASRHRPFVPLRRRLLLGLGCLGLIAAAALLLVRLASSFALPDDSRRANLDSGEQTPPPSAPPPVTLLSDQAEGPLVAVPPLPEEPKKLAAPQGFVIPTLTTELAPPPEFPNCYAHRGDTPMTRTWKTLGLPTLLAALWLPAPVVAQQETGGTKPSVSVPAANTDLLADKMADLKGDLKALTDALDALKKAMENLASKEEARAMSHDLALKAVSDEIAKLRAELESLRTRLGTTQTSAMYTPSAGQTGRVQIINEFTEQVTVVVNDRTYRVLPGQQELTGPIPAGTFNYQVLGVQATLQSRTLAANETYTIRVFAR